MNDNVESLILEQLRLMRGEIGAMRGDLAVMQSKLEDLEERMDEGFSDVNGRIDGLVLMVHLLATHLHHVEERVERLESR